MADLVINLLASVIAGAAVWAFSWLRRRQRIERMRAFFGVGPETRALFVIARHFSAGHDLSVHRDDAAALIELAALVMACGGRSELVGYDRAPVALGGVPELCVGGPLSNPRAASHLRLLVPGVRFVAGHDRTMTLTIGTTSYPWQGTPGDDESDRPDAATHAVLVKTFGSPPQAPVFLVCGMTAASNRAAAHHLTLNHRDLSREYGSRGRFALLLSLRGLSAYGSDAIVEVTDITDIAFLDPVGAAV